MVVFVDVRHSQLTYAGPEPFTAISTLKVELLFLAFEHTETGYYLWRPEARLDRDATDCCQPDRCTVEIKKNQHHDTDRTDREAYTRRPFRRELDCVEPQG